MRKIRHSQRRLAQKSRVEIFRIFSSRNILSGLLFIGFVALVAPVLTTFVYSRMYTPQSVLGEESGEVQAFVLLLPVEPSQLQIESGKNIYMFDKNRDELTRSAERVDLFFRENEVIPDYAAENLAQFCENIRQNSLDLEKIVLIGKRFQLLPLAYSCDNFGFELELVESGAGNISDYYGAGAELINLIWQLNLS